MANLNVKDLFEKLGARYRGKLNRVLFIGLAGLLGVRILLYLFVEGVGVSEMPADAKVVTLPSDLTDESKVVQDVRSMIQPWGPLADNPTYSVLATTNMFDPARVNKAVDLERKALEQYGLAAQRFAQYEQAAKQGNPDAGRADLDAARQAAEQAISNKPDYQAAIKLKQMILDAQGIKAPEAAAISNTATTTSTATATPASSGPPAARTPAK